MKIENLDSFEKEELLRWFFQWLPMDKRGEMMARYPQHYNKLLGRDEPLLEVIKRGGPLPKGCTVRVNGEEKDWTEDEVVDG